MAHVAPDNPDGDERRSPYITHKGGLRHLLIGEKPVVDDVIGILTHAAQRMGELALRATWLVKLHILHQFEERGTVPLVNKTLMLNALKVVGAQTNRGRKPDGRSTLVAFYEKHFHGLLPEDDTPPSYEHLNDALGYTAETLLAAFETNIVQHYVEYVESYVNAAFGKRGEMERIRALPKEQRAAATSAFTSRLRAIKTDLLDVDNKDKVMKSTGEDAAWAAAHRATVLPDKRLFAKGLIAYDIHCRPQDYLLPMLRITAALESGGHKLRSAVPLRTAAMPMFFTLDTSTLVRLLYDTGVFEPLDLGKTQLLAMVVDLKPVIWARVFRTNRRIFHDTSIYEFNYTVKTDGVSLCAVHKRRDAPSRRKRRKRRKGAELPPQCEGAELPQRKRRKRRKPPPPQYVDKLPEDDQACLRAYKVVGIDPGKRNLLYCSTEDGEEHCAYSQDQRRQETKKAKYAGFEHVMKEETVIEGMTVIEWESELSKFNFKTVSYSSFRTATQAKLRVHSKIAPFYAAYWFRKRKLNAFFNGQRSEQRMLGRMKETFGDPRHVVLGIGDWEQRQHCKFKEPTKGKGLRETLRRGGYKVLLVDEFRTTKQCAHCQVEGAQCETFLRMPNPNKKKRAAGEERLVHGLLLCQQCKRRWTRDRNAAVNIARLTRLALAGLPRPPYLSRSEAARGGKRAAKDSAERKSKIQCCASSLTGV
jgi:hypothetical protein